MFVINLNLVKIELIIMIKYYMVEEKGSGVFGGYDEFVDVKEDDWL